MQILKLGSRGEDVKKYQRILCLKPDGIFGQLTDQYVRAFQREHGLSIDGMIGTKTAAKLDSIGAADYVVTTKTPAGKFKLSERSIGRLAGVHPDLVKVIYRAIEKDLDFMVIEGMRSIEQQKKYVASGASKTMNSRHLTGHAVDLGVMLDGQLTWDWKHYERLAKNVKEAAKEVGVTIEWGGDWKSLKDGPHFQLPHGYK